MNAKAMILGSCAVLTIGIAGAQAGPCAGEIEALSKTLAAKDAGSGPTSGTSGAAATATPQAGQHPPTSSMSQATQGSAASPEDVRRQTAGQPTAAQQGAAQHAGPPAQHPPTAAMSQAMGGQGVGMGGQHPPTAATGQATQSQAAASENVGRAGATSMDASATLAHARMLDQQGKEAECMQAVQQAKQQAGAR